MSVPYTTDYTFSYCMKSSSGNAHDTKFRGRNFSCYKISVECSRNRRAYQFIASLPMNITSRTFLQMHTIVGCTTRKVTGVEGG